MGIGSKITLIREGRSEEKIFITGRVVHINDNQIATVEHKWGWCFEDLKAEPGKTRTK